MNDSARTFASWLLVATMLVTSLGPAAGSIECLRGMSEKGPMCPMCRGQSRAPVSGPSIHVQCCRYVAADAAPTQLATAPAGHSRFLSATFAVAHIASDGSSPAPSRLASCRPGHDRDGPPAPSPLYLSNLLRL
ncbi:MAG TPA: hypothetical protein VGK89_01645 [Candidatus Eisenbacteria bacterium]|jgi:hypothetical protein